MPRLRLRYLTSIAMVLVITACGDDDPTLTITARPANEVVRERLGLALAHNSRPSFAAGLG